MGFHHSIYEAFNSTGSQMLLSDLDLESNLECIISSEVCKDCYEFPHMSCGSYLISNGRKRAITLVCQGCQGCILKERGDK